MHAAKVRLPPLAVSKLATIESQQTEFGENKIKYIIGTISERKKMFWGLATQVFSMLYL